MATETKEKVSRFDDTDEVELLSWKSEERVHKKRTKEFYSTILVLALLVSIIMFFIEGVMPVLVIWAIVFFVWTVSKTPPAEASHSMTNKGIKTSGTFYAYDRMRFYWFEKDGDKGLLRVVMTGLPGQLSLVISEDLIEKIRAVMGEAGLPFVRPKPGVVDRLVKWFSEKVPLE